MLCKDWDSYTGWHDKRVARMEDWEGCQACKKKPCACNGKLLSANQIKGWIGSETTKGKKRKADEISDNEVAARAVARGLEN